VNPFVIANEAKPAAFSTDMFGHVFSDVGSCQW